MHAYVFSKVQEANVSESPVSAAHQDSRGLRKTWRAQDALFTIGAFMITNTIWGFLIISIV